LEGELFAKGGWDNEEEPGFGGGFGRVPGGLRQRGGGGENAVSLDEAIRASARQISGELRGWKAAVVSFNAPSGAFSEYVIEELMMELANSRLVTVVTRQELDLAREELRFNLSSEVSDESAQSIGQMLGAEAVITGTLVDTGKAWRFRLRAINVESAALESAPAFDIGKRDSRALHLLGPAASVPASRAAPPRPQAGVPEGFVLVEGGTFTMGSPSNEPDRWDDEGPQRQVTVKSFYMGKHELSQREWRDLMGNNPSRFKGDNLPVEMVNWFEAIEYCNKRSVKERLAPVYRGSGNSITCDWGASGYRLPTEAEWEYAAKGGNKS
jgi:formylglycine-generating enzyme required for sulfatase activity